MCNPFKFKCVTNQDNSTDHTWVGTLLIVSNQWLACLAGWLGGEYLNIYTSSVSPLPGLPGLAGLAPDSWPPAAAFKWWCSSSSSSSSSSGQNHRKGAKHNQSVCLSVCLCGYHTCLPAYPPVPHLSAHRGRDAVGVTTGEGAPA